MSLFHFQIISAALFSIGLYGVLARRNAVLVLLAIELMLNAVSINFVATAAFLDHQNFMGQVAALFVIALAAAEIGLALAIILRSHRHKSSVNIEEIDLLKG